MLETKQLQECEQVILHVCRRSTAQLAELLVLHTLLVQVLLLQMGQHGASQEKFVPSCRIYFVTSHILLTAGLAERGPTKHPSTQLTGSLRHGSAPSNTALIRWAGSVCRYSFFLTMVLLGC